MIQLRLAIYDEHWLQIFGKQMAEHARVPKVVASLAPSSGNVPPIILSNRHTSLTLGTHNLSYWIYMSQSVRINQSQALAAASSPGIGLKNTGPSFLR